MNNTFTKLKTQFTGQEETARDVDTSRIRRRLLIKRMLLFFFKTPKRASLVIIVIGAIGFGGYYISHKQTPEEKAKQELATAVAAVGHYMILPEGDQPVLATVTDAKTLITQQAFFAGSVNGDQLLLYPKNLKAIIWSPSRKMIVNVGPIQQSQLEPTNSQANSASNGTGNQQQTVQAVVPVPDATLSVEIRNGTSKNGLASQVAEKLSAHAGYNILKVSDADKKTYLQTIVVNRVKDERKNQLASALVAELGASAVSELPSGEKETEADVLVILGDN